jgi:hypothetical protein
MTTDLAEALERVEELIETFPHFTTRCAMNLEADLRALVAAVRGREWRAIETAPKDGTIILAWPCEFAAGLAAVPAFWYVHPSVQGWTTDLLDCADYEFEPTLWQPLPPPPDPQPSLGTKTR